MNSPIQQALDAVDMTPIDGACAPPDGMPFATHSGVLNLADLKVPVYRLNDGRAVVSEEGMAAFLTWLGA